MPAIVPPRLDDRSWDDLRRELIRRIPAHAPGWSWTDHNPSDPGVALLELFAWLSEQLLRRVNLVPEASHLEFLRLLGIPLRQAAPARTWLKFDLPKGISTPVLVPYSPIERSTVASAGKIPFQVIDELEVLPVECLGAIKKNYDPTDDEKTAIGILPNNVVPEDYTATYYETLRILPPASPLPEGELLDETVDKTLWVAILTPEPVYKAFGQTIQACRTELLGTPEAPKVRVLSLAIGIQDRLLQTELDDPDGALTHPSSAEATAGPEVHWDVSTGLPLDEGATGSEANNVRYDRLSILSDTTSGLSRSGVVRLQLPDSSAPVGTWVIADEDEQTYPGVGEQPPSFDDPKLEARILFWLRARRTKPGALPQVVWVDTNVVPAEQAITAPPEVVGHGTSQPGQTLRLSRSPVIAASLVLEVYEPATGWTAWTRVDDLAASGPTDSHYALDTTIGELRFGDGLQGRPPGLGETVRARTYRYGGGAAGNIGAGQVKKVQDGPDPVLALKVTNLVAARGGRDGETVAEARVRIPEVLRHNDRAVAADDFRALALETPGQQVGRVHVMPRYSPRDTTTELPGVVSLIVVPAWDPQNPAEPKPDREMLRNVCAWLEPRRLCTTELRLAAPEYVPVWLSVSVELMEGYGIQTVQRWVDLALRQNFAPLPPYGPAGEGWPFGRDLRIEDVQAAALQVEGVRLVTDAVAATTSSTTNPNSATAPYTVATTSSTPRVIVLQDWQLPAVRGVQISVAATAPALFIDGATIGLDGKTPAPPATDPPPKILIAIPTLREVC